MPPLHFGVAGLRVGYGRANRILKSRKARLIACAESDPQRAENFRKECGFDTIVSDYRDLVDNDEIEAIWIALPTQMHHEATMAALRGGKHVICEKPPAADIRQARRMVDEAKKRGLVLTWGLQRRFLPGPRGASRAIAEGKLGSVYHVHARYVRARFDQLATAGGAHRMLRQGGGVMLDLGVHALDMGWSAIGCPKPTRVVAAGHTAFPDWVRIDRVEDMAEDNIFVMIFFETGQSMMLEAVFFCQSEDLTADTPTVRFYGDKAGLFTPDMTLTSGGMKGGGKFTPPSRKLKTLKSWDRDPATQLLENFIGAVQGKNELLVTAEQGVDLMRIIDATRRSWLEGREIRTRS